MAGIDAHQHFWRYQPERDAWITEEMAVLRRDFLPEDLEPELRLAGMDGSVLIQSEPADGGNAFLIGLANRYDFIQGIVAWTDFRRADIATSLEQYAQHPKLKGFRPMLQSDAPRNAMLDPEFMRGVAALKPYGFTFDLLVLPDQLPYVFELVKAFPDQAFVIDHLAKPEIRAGALSAWARWMQRIATCENVYCKSSGMVTEADWKHWRAADFGPYLDVVTGAFGTGRLLYGSDWPVCLLAGDYAGVHGVAREYFSRFTVEEQAAVFGGNARRFYNLSTTTN